MENLVDHFRKSFEEAYDRGRDHGFECCFLQMKIHLGKYLISDGKYKSADSMLEYVLSLELESLELDDKEIKTTSVHKPTLEKKFAALPPNDL